MRAQTDFLFAPPAVIMGAIMEDVMWCDEYDDDDDVEVFSIPLRPNAVMKPLNRIS